MAPLPSASAPASHRPILRHSSLPSSLSSLCADRESIPTVSPRHRQIDTQGLRIDNPNQSTLSSQLAQLSPHSRNFVSELTQEKNGNLEQMLKNLVHLAAIGKAVTDSEVFTDPILCEPMPIRVLHSCGNSFSLESIETWSETQKRNRLESTCPCCRKPLKIEDLVEDKAWKDMFSDVSPELFFSDAIQLDFDDFKTGSSFSRTLMSEYNSSSNIDRQIQILELLMDRFPKNGRLKLSYSDRVAHKGADASPDQIQKGLQFIQLALRTKNLAKNDQIHANKCGAFLARLIQGSSQIEQYTYFVKNLLAVAEPDDYSSIKPIFEGIPRQIFSDFSQENQRLLDAILASRK